MIELERTYENFRGDTVTKKLYFHMSLKELKNMESFSDDELKAAVESATEENIDDVIKEFSAKKSTDDSLKTMEELILGSYGYISDDGEEFIKDPKFTAAFEKSTAYEDLLVDLMTVEGYLEKFLAGIVPKKMQANVVSIFDKLKDKKQ